MRVIVYKDKKGEWRWRAFSDNGRMVANCGEGYKRRASAMQGLWAMALVDTARITVTEKGKPAKEL